MEKGFRESMRWVHTWSGLIVGWLLFAIFVTGTSSYYKNEITLWMKPEFHKSKVTEKTIEIAIDKAIESSKKSNKVNVSLPNSRSNLISIRAEGISTNNNSNQKNVQNKGRAEVYSKNKNNNSNVQRNKISNQKEKELSRDKNNNSNQNNIQNKQPDKKAGKRRRTPPTYYDASTGELIKGNTQTAGGDFLYRFHFELYSIPRNIARWIIGIATMSMLVAIITGIIIHKRIFKDIFTFRPKNNPRGWMDAHILPAVAALPFFIMITYSGLLLFTNTLMPWAIQVHYDDFRSYKNAMRSAENTNKEGENKKQIDLNNPKIVLDNGNNKRNINIQRGNSDNLQKNKNTQRNENAQRGNRNNLQKNDTNKRKSSIQSVKKQTIENTQRNTNIQRIVNSNALRAINRNRNNTNTHRLVSATAQKQILLYKPSKVTKKVKDLKKLTITKEKLLAIMTQANKIWPDNVGGFSIIKDESKKSIQVTISPKNSSSLFNTRQKKSIIFDGKTSKLIKHTTPVLKDSLILNTSGAFRSLHEAKFADSTLRFIFFICGLSGVIISGTGLILWVEKRKKKNSKKKSFGFILVEKLNLGTIMGIMIALAVYFIVNRLITIDESSRRTLEINAFFIAWVAAYIHAFVRNISKAWIEQLRFAAKLFIFIPILNAILVFDSFGQIFNRDSIFLYFDLFFIFTAIVFTFVSSILIKKSKIKDIKCQ